MKKNSKLYENIKIKKTSLFIGIMLLSISIFVGIVVVLLNKDRKPKTLNNTHNVGVYVTADIKLESSFANSNNENDYELFYLININDFYYIIKSNHKLDNSNLTVSGITEEIPNTIKQYAINYLNNIGLDVNSNNFANYVNNYLININYDINDKNKTVFLFMSIGIVISLILIMHYIYKYIKRTKFLKKYRNVFEEIENEKSYYFLVGKTYLTTNYLISVNKNIKIYNLKDIIWVYPFERRYKGKIVLKSIFIMDNSGNTNNIAIIKDMKHINDLENFYDKLIDKIPNALFGYTNINKEKSKKLIH